MIGDPQAVLYGGDLRRTNLGGDDQIERQAGGRLSSAREFEAGGPPRDPPRTISSTATPAAVHTVTGRRFLPSGTALSPSFRSWPPCTAADTATI